MAARWPLVLGPDGLHQQLQSGDVPRAPNYTVAQLPTLTAADKGAFAFATNGRAIAGVGIVGLGGLLFEAAGNGTGCLVSWNGSAWKVAGTTTTVSA